MDRDKPKKPIYEYYPQTNSLPEEYYVYCPSCKEILNCIDGYKEFGYCPFCGQALSMESDEDD